MPEADFRLDGPSRHHVPGLIHLFGIESPSLTAGMASVPRLQDRAPRGILLHALRCLARRFASESAGLKEQFSNSPDLDNRILDAVMEALSAFTSMSKQALESEKIRADLKSILLGPGKLYESLRAQAGKG